MFEHDNRLIMWVFLLKEISLVWQI